MSGQITGISTLNGTTGIFGQLFTTNNTNVNIPAVGVAGGTGDKIIFALALLQLTRIQSEQKRETFYGSQVLAHINFIIMV